MEPLYTVYFGGEVLAGHEPGQVKARLSQLFKVGDKTLDRLFNGKLHVLKRDCDKATALKYKKAMENAGAKPVIKQSSEAPASPAPTHAVPDRPSSAAEKIAALAAAPDVDDYRSAAPADTPPPPKPSAPAAEGDIDLAPPHSDVLRPDERTAVEQREIDTGSLAVDSAAERLAEPAGEAPPAPDVSHLDMGEVGDDIPTLEREVAPPAPNTDALALSPEGTDFSDCAGPDPQAPELDLSALDLAPAGSEVLESRYRKSETAAAPATDHIALDE